MGGREGQKQRDVKERVGDRTLEGGQVERAECASNGNRAEPRETILSVWVERGIGLR